MSGIANRIRQELQRLADLKIRKSADRFFKEPIKVHGVPTPLVRKIARAHFELMPKPNQAGVWPLCDQLWQSGYLEEAVVAALWAYNLRKSYEPGDFPWFEKWISRYVHNWAACDTFCNHAMGAFLEKYPAYLEKLKGWAVSPNRWLRRAAAVSLIVPAKAGKFLEEVFGIADLLLEDPDDMVQKGYGWLLKVTAHRHQDKVFQYVMDHKSRMPRTALRYAIEKMPAALKRQAMA